MRRTSVDVLEQVRDHLKRRLARHKRFSPEGACCVALLDELIEYVEDGISYEKESE